MKKYHKTRFEDAMAQLNSAFEKAQEAENKENISSNTAAIEDSALLASSTKFDEAKPFIEQKLPNKAQQKENILQGLDQAVEKLPNKAQQKENILQGLDQAVEKLQARKIKKSLDLIAPENNKQKEEIVEVTANKADKKIQNLLEQLVQNTVDKRILMFLEQKLAENTHSLQDDFLDGQEVKYLTSTKNIKKNRSQLEEKILQYSKVKLFFFVNLGQSKIKFKNLFALKEGDVFSLDTSTKQTLSFFINQKPVGSGKIVNSKENRGFQIDSFYQNL